MNRAEAVERLRRGLRRVKRSRLPKGPTKRSLSGTPALRIDGAIDPHAAETYQRALCSHQFTSSDANLRLAIMVEQLTLDDDRTFELAGLAIALSRAGVDTVFAASDDSPPPGTDALLLPADVTTAFDPASQAEPPLLVAWVHGFPTTWVRRRGIDWFDLVLCGSTALRDELVPFFSGPIEVFPHAVDTRLFALPDAEPDVRAGLVSFVAQRTDHRPLVDAIGSMPFAVPTAIFDSPGTYPRSLRRFVRSPVGPLGRGAVLQRAAVAFSGPASGEPDREVLELSALEALASGAAVVSRHDLSRVGLASPMQVPDGRLGSVVDVPADRSSIERDRDHVGRLHNHEARARRFLEIIPEVPRLADGGRTLGFYPNYWNHPYVQNLYRGLRSRGVRAVPVTRPESLLDAAGLRGRSLFHLQWTAPVLAGATSAGDAVERADAFLRQLDDLRSARTPIIWTVHNVLPHDCAHPAAEIQLCQGLADRSDVVHVLNNATLEATAPLYQLPADRVRVIPHYDDPVTLTVSPSAARARLSLGDDDVVYLAFGRIRPYKQLGRLLDAFAEHRRSHPRSRLLVAGHLERFSGSARLAARCRREPGVVARLGRVADDDIELLFAASDATVVSYPILNSAVAVTSVAHGCPVAAVDTGGLPETVGQDGGLVFGSDENLADVLDRLYALVTETDIRERTTALGRRRSAAVMTTAFAQVVATLVSREPDA